MNQYYQVNWINGMKVTSGHFIDLENHFISRIQNTFRGFVNDLTYGWIPDDGVQSVSPHFLINANQSTIKVLRGFTALTPGGYLLQVPPNLEFPLTKQESDASRVWLTISLKPFSRIPFGKINEQESPLRVPNAMPELHFDFIPLNDLLIHSLGNDVIPVGKYTGQGLGEEKDYIPPCTSIQSNRTLVEVCKDVMVAFNEFEAKVFDLLKRSYNRDSVMLTNLLNFFNLNKTAIDWYMPYQPPVFMMEKIQQVARIIHYSHEGNFKDEPGKLLNRIITYKYDHLEILKAVEIARGFVKNHSDLLPDAFSIGV
jgi:hypothetical protein